MGNVKDKNSGFTESHSKYQKYFLKAVNYPDKNITNSVLNTVIPTRETLQPEEYCKLQKDGYHKYESGYSIMPDGTGYIAFHIDLPGITPEMFDWFFSWHPVETERYVLWNPDEHIDAFIDNEDRLKLLNQNLSFNKRLWDIHVLYREKTEENEIHDSLISYHSPFEYGFSEKDYTDYKWTAVCANDGAICHFVRKKEGGSELRSRIWTGENTLEAEEEHSLPASFFPVEDAEIFIRKTALHYITDFSHLASILPSLYKEYCLN